jgi:hypothetical protein
MQQITSSVGGKYFDKFNEADRATLNAQAFEWPWKLTTSSYFCYHMGGPSPQINKFDNMIAAARTASATAVLNVYAHALADSVKPNQSSRRQVVPHPRNTADIVLQLVKLPENEWTVENMTHFMNEDSVVSVDTAMLIPAWHVKLVEGCRVSQFVCTPRSSHLHSCISRTVCCHCGASHGYCTCLLKHRLGRANL